MYSVSEHRSLARYLLRHGGGWGVGGGVLTTAVVLVVCIHTCMLR